MTDSELIDKIFADPFFPTHPRKQVGTKKVKENGKDREVPVYAFFLDKSDAYVDGGKVVIPFVSSKARKMRYVIYYATLEDFPGSENFPDTFRPHLVYKTEFRQTH